MKIKEPLKMSYSLVIVIHIFVGFGSRSGPACYTCSREVGVSVMHCLKVSRVRSWVSRVRSCLK